ncbi:MAG: hypothetical protein LZF62_360108 [Nitrospira sp.]|nr:MAG: hypothetical protein LZF62_360108 [Nitrospira sp.]
MCKGRDFSILPSRRAHHVHLGSLPRGQGVGLVIGAFWSVSRTQHYVGPAFSPVRLFAVSAASNEEAEGAAADGCMQFRDRQSLRA